MPNLATLLGCVVVGAPVFTINLYGEPGLLKPEIAAQFTLNLVVELNRTANPVNVFWTPMSKWHQAVRSNQVKPAPSRAIDFLYVSSNCHPVREAMALLLRTKVTAANLRWAYGGRCRAGAPASMASPNWGGNLTKDIMESKTMLSMSRSQNPDLESLDEKLGLPVLLGATIPVYVGNGHRLITKANYPKVMLDRSEYGTDELFADALVALLHNNTELLRRQREMYAHPFHFGSAAARAFVQAKNITLGPEGSVIRVYTPVKGGRRRPQVFLDQLDYLFENKYQFAYGRPGDSPIHLTQCCW